MLLFMLLNPKGAKEMKKKVLIVLSYVLVAALTCGATESAAR